uniref:Methyl-accepting transducer domain-containing protein n=1 Tax=candidate division WOR-3 bacterium TaxID=2052148 RepID=A0A7C4TG13_UNCW3
MNKKLIHLWGIAGQFIFFFIITKRFALPDNLYLYYTILIFLVFLYNIFIRQETSRVITSLVYLISTFGAGLIAGFLTGIPRENFFRLLLDGIISGVMAMMTFYYAKNFLSAEEQIGFDSSVELGITIFGTSTYIILTILPLTIIDGLIVALLFLISSFFVGFVITSALKKSALGLISVVNGDTSRKPLSYTTILQELFKTISERNSRINSSINDVSNVSKEIRTSAEDLSSASEEMNASLEEVSSTVQHIAKGAQEQSEAITAIAKAIDELNNLTSSISSQVKMANVSSRRTTDSAKKGLELSAHLAKILKEIFEQTKIIEDKMAVLREQATEIKKIVDIIQGITEQTDLLALNAAIEAARVGEQGRGFAVVADEIRNLANESQHSSSTVEELISQINKTTQELNNLLNLEREKIDEANLSAGQSEEEFTGIVKAVDLVTDMIGRINEAAGNQLQNTAELVKKVEEVAQVATDTAAATQQVSAAVQQQTASMEEFTSTAQMLSQIVNRLEEAIQALKK